MTGLDPVTFVFMNMNDQNILSVFVDESGNFGDPDDLARYCIVTLVFQRQSLSMMQDRSK